ncbi:MAG: hypothetical protein AB1724_11795 [Thermodesulfobacteriota bacterium]
MRSSFFSTTAVYIFAATILCLAGCDDNGHGRNPDEYRVCVNGVMQPGRVVTRNTAGGLVADAGGLASRLPGMRLYPMNNPLNAGIALQYGKSVSFASVGFASGFCSAREVAMTPPMESAAGIYWAPLNFFAQAVSGDIQLSEDERIITVTMPPPGEIGDKFPEAGMIAGQLKNDFIVQPGEICRTDPIRLYAAGYVEDCNGNNAGASYLVTQVPPSPRSGELSTVPMILKMDQDEAFVWIGRTPPETRYFSYQLYLMNRFYADEGTPTVKKLYARLADAVNSYNFPFSNDPFEQFFVLIIAGNRSTCDAVERAVLAAGIDSGRILSLVIPNRTEPDLPIRFGLDLAADSFNFLHRASVFASEVDEDAYTADPTLEILRVTPMTELASNPMERQDSRDRRTGVREQDTPGLAEMLEELKTEIIAAHGGDYQYVRELGTGTWMFPGGDVAIAEAEDVLGETNDTLYLKTREFILHEDDLIVVFGANHDLTGKSVYSNVSCYGLAENGVGGIVSTPWSPEAPGRRSYFGTAPAYLRDLPDADPDRSNMLYVYKFARTALDENTFAIPYNPDGSFTGHNNGDTVFMGFRIYVDRLTTVGPWPGDVRDGSYFSVTGPPDGEVFFDQAILFTNSSP